MVVAHNIDRSGVAVQAIVKMGARQWLALTSEAAWLDTLRLPLTRAPCFIMGDRKLPLVRSEVNLIRK